MNQGKPNCYKCRYRRSLPGDAHSRCQHPDIDDANPYGEMMAILASVGRSRPIIDEAAVKLGIQANPHGIRAGWFNWPWNFDPTWLIACNGFKAITQPDEQEKNT